MCLVRDRSLAFYCFLALLGFTLVLVDLTPGHGLGQHLHLYQEDPDIVAGTILLFFSGFGIGNRSKKE